MYRALPCSDYYGNSVAMPDIHRSTPNSLAAFRFRQSPFRNLTTVWRDRLSDTTFVLYCLWQLPCGQFMLRLLSLISVVPQCDVYNYLPSPPKDTTARTIVQPMQALSLYLSSYICTLLNNLIIFTVRHGVRQICRWF